MKTILAAVDFSESTADVIQAASGLARGLRAKLVIVHVLPPPIVVGRAEPFLTTSSDLLLDAEKRADERLSKLKTGLTLDLPKVTTSRIVGTPIATIVAQARELKADYIVVASHGHGAVYDLLIGSTTRGVLQDAPCPVVVVPALVRPKPESLAPEQFD